MLRDEQYGWITDLGEVVEANDMNHLTTFDDLNPGFGHDVDYTNIYRYAGWFRYGTYSKRYYLEIEGNKKKLSTKIKKAAETLKMNFGCSKTEWVWY